MKTIISLICGIVLMSSSVNAQLVINIHTKINNNDVKTRANQAALILELIAINAKLQHIKDKLADAKAKHREQLDLQYTSNKYDKQNSSFLTSMLSTAKSFGPAILAQQVSMPYMTQEKKDYLNQVALDKAVLAAVQSISADKIKSSKRQEIYQLRNKLLREFSKTDREARGMLYLPVTGLILPNSDQFIGMLDQLKNLEITL